MFSASAPRLVLRRGAPYAGSVVAGAVGYHALQQEETAGQLGPLLVAEALAALSSNVLGASPATTTQTVGFVAKVADFWGTHSGKLARLQLEQELRKIRTEDDTVDGKQLQRLVVLANQLSDHEHVQGYAELLGKAQERHPDHLRMLVDATEKYKEGLQARRAARSVSAYEHARASKVSCSDGVGRAAQMEVVAAPPKIHIVDPATVEPHLAAAWALYAYADCTELPQDLARGLSPTLQTRIARAQLPPMADATWTSAATGQSWLFGQKLTALLFGGPSSICTLSCSSGSDGACSALAASDQCGSSSSSAGGCSHATAIAAVLAVTAASAIATILVAQKYDVLPPQLNDIVESSFVHIRTPTWEEAKSAAAEQQAMMQKNVLAPVREMWNKSSVKDLKDGATEACRGLMKRVRSDQGWTFLRSSGSEKSIKGSDLETPPPEINA
mmetsp:Transcript_4452/g.10898  ORF Transcript_4452/g.10898 Transcript_4452/m.10898 type:complete len:444 (+) Transcript_4452:422-1753(+)|eukprot:CAMPEP_0178999486 /NCGR_PEP_ID=MMETSP0795-20121207/10094_1 /TAXON_ID=88552 /ORGANISM="Amoebophrya sp., Strain Ameob2" /LENGTH=443 /DNA_ID=CAMNT_0020692279 /DNA_START=362 /DNA_END=1693 /DNA_ORIENTATION=-